MKVSQRLQYRTIRWAVLEHADGFRKGCPWLWRKTDLERTTAAIQVHRQALNVNTLESTPKHKAGLGTDWEGL